MKINEKVLDKEYGEGIVTKILDDSFFVTFEEKKYPVLYTSSMKRDSKIPKLTIVKENKKEAEETVSYTKLNSLFSEKLYKRSELVDELKDKDLLRLEISDLSFVFNDSDISLEKAKTMVKNTIEAARKGRKFGSGYLTSLGSIIHTSIMQEYVYIKDYRYLPSFFSDYYLKFIYLANKYPENEKYNNLEVIIPMYDAPLYSWINLENNTFNLRAFQYANYQQVDTKGYKKYSLEILDEDLQKKVKKMGTIFKDTFFEVFKKDDYFIIKGSEVNLFVGTTRDFIEFRKEI